MTTRIAILSTQVANQIAAGEVVERPASVVKELLENSLDAGATQIDIEIKQGGLQSILVRDNGAGIHPDDLALALAPHATSKITDIMDLNTLASLGFRGEALASIASVSELILTSYQAGADMAWQIRLPHHAAEPEVQPAAHPLGTTVEVANLFVNTPVRRKFLKSERTEFNHIEELVTALALAALATSMNLVHNDRTIFQVKSAKTISEIQQRVAKLLGKQFVEHALFIEQERLGLKLTGWVLPSEQSRAATDQQYFFVNGRSVKDKLLRHAVNTVYTAELAAGRYPGYVLYLECDPAVVDVNVHPTKHEVRFAEPRLVHDFIVSALSAALLTNNNEPRLQNDGASLKNRFSIAQPILPERLPIDNASAPKLLDIFGGKWLIARSGEQLRMVDYEQAYRYLAHQQWARKIVRAQPLLIPESVTLTATQIERLLTWQPELLAYGIELQQTAPNKIMLRKVPEMLRKGNLAQLCAALATLTTTDEMLPTLLNFVVAPVCNQAEAILILERLAHCDTTELLTAKICRDYSADELRQLI